MSVLIVARILGAVLTLCYVLSLWRATKLSNVSWEQLVLRLSSIRIDYLRQLSDGKYSAADGHLPVNAQYLYSQLGGAEGFRRMRQNAGVLIMLAAYTDTWTPGISYEVVNQMREDGKKLNQLAWRIAFLWFVHSHGRILAGFIQETATLYLGLVEQLLHLYDASHISRRPALEAACSIM